MEQYLDKYIKTSSDYKTYVSNGTCRYPFAIESWKNDQFSYVYTTETNDLNKIEKLLESDHHLFEIIKRDVCKLYMDFDKQSITDLASFVNNIIDIVNIHLDANVVIDDVVILTNTGEQINSLHLIFNTITMDKKDQKMLVQYINQTTDLDIDERVYTLNRNFRCVNQSKSAKMNPLIQRINSFPILETFVGINVNGDHRSFDTIFEIKKDNKRVITPRELIHLFLENKYEEIFTKNVGGCWCKITSIISQFYPDELDNWFMESANDKYSYEDNKSFLIDGDKWDDVNYMFVIINTKIKQPIHYSQCSASTESIKTYLSTWFTEANIELILNNETFIQNDIEYTCSNGFVEDRNEFRINYIYDTIDSVECKDIVILDTIQIAKDKLMDFLKSRDKLFILKSAWGTGKTHHIMKRAIRHYVNKRILLITGINSLNLTFTTMFNEFLDPFDTTPFVSHLSLDNNLNKQPKVICSIQSLYKLAGNHYDLVIMDESESVLNSYFCHATFKHSSCHSLFNDMVHILHSSKKIIALDADVSESKIKLLHSITEGVAKVYKNKQLSFQSTQFILHTESELEFIYHIIDEQKSNKKLVIPCATRKSALNLLYIFTNQMSESNRLTPEYMKLIETYYESIKHRTILYIDRTGCSIFKPTIGISHCREKLDNEAIYKDLDSFLINNSVDTFIYTPTITTGLSINTKYFDKCYSLSNNNSINYNEYIQMLMRTRILDETHIWLNKKLLNVSNQQMTDVKESRDKLNKVFKELKYGNELEDELVLNSNHYCDVQLINITTLYNTRKNFVYNLIQVMRYHKLKYSWNTKIPISNSGIDLKLNTSELEEIEFENWKSIQLLSFVDYCKQKMRLAFRGQPVPKITDDTYKSYIYDEPTNEESVFKTSILYGLIDLAKLSIVKDAIELFVPDIQYIKQLHTLLYSELNHIVEYSYDLKTERTQTTYEVELGADKVAISKVYHLCCEQQIVTALNYYDLKAIWLKYIHKENYKQIRDVRRLVHTQNTNSLLNTKLSLTQLDDARIKFELARLVSVHFNIDFEYCENRLTNGELVDIVKKMKVITNPNKKTAVAFLKSHLKFLDFVVEYLTSNTTRNTDKFRIQPRQHVSKNYLIKWTISRGKLIKRLDERFMYLRNFETYKNHNLYDIYKDIEPLLLSSRVNSIKEKKQRCLALLLSETTLENAFKPYYYNELLYKTFDSSQRYFHTFYVSKHKNEVEVEFSTSIVKTFIKDKMRWVESGTKTIIRPYTFKQPTLKTCVLTKADILKRLVFPKIKHIEI